MSVGDDASEEVNHEPQRSHWPISILSTVASLLNMLLPLVLVRVLPPEEVGVFKIFFLYLAIFPMFALSEGLINGLGYWAGRGAAGRAAVQHSGAILLVLALLFLALALGLHPVLAEILEWPDVYALLFAVGLFGAIGAEFYVEASIAVGRIWRGALFHASFELSRTVVLVVTALVSQELFAVLTAHVVMIVLKLSVGYIAGYRLGLVKFQFSRPTLRSVGRYAFPVSLAEVFYAFVSRADQFILSTLISATQFAFYAIGCLVVPPIYILEQSVTRVLIPQLSEAFKNSNITRGAELHARAVEQLALLTIPAVAGLVVFAEPIIVILFTSQYASAAGYLSVFAFSYLLFLVPFDAAARASGDARWMLRVCIIFAVISLTTAYTATEFFGPYGALGAMLGSRFLLTWFGMQYARKHTGWRWAEFLPLGSLLRISFLSVMIGTVCVVIQPVFSSDITWFLICGSLFVMLYFGILMWWKLEWRHGLTHTVPVLMITQTLQIGGLEKMILSLCRALRTGGEYRPRVMAFDQPPTTDDEHLIPQFREHNIPVETFRKPGRFSPAVIWRLLRCCVRHDIAIIHTHELGGLIYSSLVKLISLKRIRIVHTQHSFVHLEKNRRYSYYEKLFTRFVDELVVVSEGMLSKYVELGFPKNRMCVISNGIQFAKSATESRAAKVAIRADIVKDCTDSLAVERLSGLFDAVWLLYLARIHPVKGQEHALHIWRELSDEIRGRCVLLFVGPEGEKGELKRLMSCARQLPDGERILFTGGTHQPAGWVRASDVFLSCSTYEGMPLGPLEAVGSGMPALLSSIPGHSFLSEVTMQYDLAAPALGAQCLERLVAQVQSPVAGFYEELWERSAWIRSSYSVENMAQRYRATYEQSLEMKPLFPFRGFAFLRRNAAA